MGQGATVDDKEIQRWNEKDSNLTAETTELFEKKVVPLYSWRFKKKRQLAASSRGEKVITLKGNCR